MAVDVRLATRADRDELVRLFHAIDVHYWGEVAPSRADGRAVGLATFAVLYPAPGPGGQLFMKDLFTLAESRGQGVGRALMGFLARLAVERGCVKRTTRRRWRSTTGSAPHALPRRSTIVSMARGSGSWRRKWGR